MTTAPTLRARSVLMRFSQRIRHFRGAANITQGELADRSGVQRNFISLIERGKANPSLATMALLAEALGCTVSDLVSADE